MNFFMDTLRPWNGISQRDGGMRRGQRGAPINAFGHGRRDTLAIRSVLAGLT